MQNKRVKMTLKTFYQLTAKTVVIQPSPNTDSLQLTGTSSFDVVILTHQTVTNCNLKELLWYCCECPRRSNVF